MNKDQYLRMCEATGQEIEWDRVPPDIEDFPESVWIAMQIFHSLGNRVYPDIGYIGKDFTNLSLLFEEHRILEHEKEWCLELLNFLDTKSIEESQRSLKAAMDKVKRK